MAKFTFRLATLLRLREATRDERRAELAEAYHVDDVLRRHIDEVAEELNRLERECRKVAAPGTVNLDRLIDAQRYDLVLRSRQSELHGQREAIGAEIQRRREKLLTADRDVRVLEKLREKHALRHQQEESRREAKQIDEVAQRCAARRFSFIDQ